MDNPNIMPPKQRSTMPGVRKLNAAGAPVNLRRHKSLPGPLRSIRPATGTPKPASYLNFKRNPYVGWFRHAPPITEQTCGSKENKHCKIAFENSERTKTVLKLLALKEKLHHKNQDDWLIVLHQRGHLRGGGRYGRTVLGTDESPTVLTRLANWILDVPLTEHQTLHSGKSLCLDLTSCISVDEDEETVSSEHTNEVGHALREDNPSSSMLESSAILSSQAEAYYAFESTITHRPRSQSLGERLDYDITQMDIVRMNRIASRHLDVQSIVKLPVVTYRDNGGDKKITKATMKKKQLRPVPESTDPQGCTDKDGPTSGQAQHINEFSWMFIPDAEESFCADDEEHDCHDEQQPQDVCVICLEKFEPGDRLRVLPCQHSFHVGCIDRWLSGSHSFDDCYTTGCPTCKKHPFQQPQHGDACIDLCQSDGSVPSWAFARIGGALAKESRHF